MTLSLGNNSGHICVVVLCHLLSVIKHMYENDEYILMDGEKRARVHPTNGVKQGCPLCPLLFSLYINDMGREISEGIEGAVTGD